MALPVVPVIVARLGWMAVGGVLTLLAKSDAVKEATQTLKEGIEGLTEDYKRDIEANRQMVDNIKKGKP